MHSSRIGARVRNDITTNHRAQGDMPFMGINPPDTEEWPVLKNIRTPDHSAMASTQIMMILKDEPETIVLHGRKVSISTELP
jgi:hypothetical protein